MKETRKAPRETLRPWSEFCSLENWGWHGANRPSWVLYNSIRNANVGDFSLKYLET